MNVMSASCRACALIFAALWIAGCASPSGSAVPGQAGDETRRGVHPDRVTVTFYTGTPEGAPYGITTGPDDRLCDAPMAASFDQVLIRSDPHGGWSADASGQRCTVSSKARRRHGSGP